MLFTIFFFAIMTFAQEKTRETVTVHLKNGEVFKGEILQKDANNIFLIINAGQKIFAQLEIDFIETEKKWTTVYFEGGKTYSGWLISQSHNLLVFADKYGKAILHISDILRCDPELIISNPQTINRPPELPNTSKLQPQPIIGKEPIQTPPVKEPISKKPSVPDKTKEPIQQDNAKEQIQTVETNRIPKKPFGSITFQAINISPSDEDFKNIYGGGWMFGGGLSFNINKFIDITLEGGYFAKTGSLTFSKEETNLSLIPLGAGLRFRTVPGILCPYIGAGARYILFSEKNVIGNVSNGDIGFVGEIGLIISPSSSFGFDIHAKYSSCRMKPADFDFNVGGLEAGAGLVIFF